MRLSKYLIYGLVDPITKHLRYVGKSSSRLTRPIDHAAIAKRNEDDSHVHNWIRKLQSQNIKYEIVVIQELQEGGRFLKQTEMFWIKYFRDKGCPLTNITNGGEGHEGLKHTAATKAKLSFSR